MDNKVGYEGILGGGGGNMLFLDYGGGSRTVCLSKIIELNAEIGGFY